LVSEQVTMWDPMNDRTMDRAAVKEKYQVEVEQLLDCFALMGDSSDNVPGVPGVGPKSAAKLIDQYQSLDALYQHVDELKKSKMKENLIQHQGDAFLSRDLIRLKLDIPLPETADSYRISDPDDEQLKTIYQELEFTSLLKELESGARIDTKSFHLIQAEDEFHQLIDALEQAPGFALDTETTSLDPLTAQLVGVSLSIDRSASWYIPVGHLEADGSRCSAQLPLDLVMNKLRPLLESETHYKLAHNLKYDYAVLKNCCGIELSGPLIDTMIAAYLAEPSKRSYKLDDLCLELGLTMTSYESVTRGDKREDSFAYVEINKAGNYSCEDVYGCLMLWEDFEPQLEQNDQLGLFHDLEMRLVPILAEMEAHGITIDPAHLDQLSEEFSSKLSKLEEKIHTLAGHEFNVNSPSQLGAVLFEELGLPHGRKTKTGYSTDIKVLEKLAPAHELPALVIEYRNIAKLLSTYVDKLKLLISPHTGRVHTSFNQAVTATGRLSSSNPNMQNIPIRTEEGNRIRAAFVPEEGKVFLSADYSQIDLRVLAHYSQDPALLKAFQSGEDIHNKTAAEIFGVSSMLITSEMRRVAKSINFGIVYGMSAFGLSSQLQISRKEAGRFIDRYFELYGGVKTFMNEIIETARTQGYVTTLLNRRRYLPEITASNKMRREFAERAAINTPIQGTAADIIKLAMLRVQDLLRANENRECKLLLQIHDELVFEMSREQSERLAGGIREAMEEALVLDVPLKVNMETSTSLAK
ncbi:MAG: DNA polymerase I, partial [Desulfobulbaceae bacterium]